jgi:hypothetical protein
MVYYFTAAGVVLAGCGVSYIVDNQIVPQVQNVSPMTKRLIKFF